MTEKETTPMSPRCLILLAVAAVWLTGCPKAGEKPASAEPRHDAHAHGDDHGAHGGHEAHGEAPHVELSPQDQQKAGVRVAAVAVRSLPTSITTTGTFEANADREAHVTPRIAGRIIKVNATVGSRVRAGEALAVLESVELGKAQSEFLKAQARRELAATTLERLRRLAEQDLTARKDVQAAETEFKQADIELEAARNQLALLGFDARRTARLVATRRLDPTVPIPAPIPGTVITRHITLGEMIHADDAEPIYVISDNRDLWVNANLYERDLARVAEGQSAVVTTTAFPGKTYRGRVTYISTALDPATRTAKARVTVANADHALKPQMFAQVAIQTGVHQSLAIPDSAVQQDQEKRQVFAFVREGDRRFEPRVLELGAKTAGHFPVISGLGAGEQVVVDGGFILKSELMKASFGEHHH